VQGDENRVQFLTGDCQWPAAAPTPPLGGGETGHDPFMRERALVLGKRAKYLEQEFAGCRRGIQRLCERPKGDLALPQGVHDRQQMRERAAKSVQFPDNEYIAGLHEVQGLG
jgi:hypothetical protein